MLCFFIFLSLFYPCSFTPVDIPLLSAESICVNATCEYDLVLQEEFTMTKLMPQSKIFKDGERMFVILENGTLRLSRSLYYSTLKMYDNYDGVEVNGSGINTADGFRRPIVSVNGQFPGPTLQVLEGSEVVVRVINKMVHRVATIHWHGIHQRNTPWMDGIGMITQCPINPMNSFTYRFKASPTGTLWYHAHIGSLKTDGVFGLLVVHKTVPSIPFFPFHMHHWLHVVWEDITINDPYRSPYYFGDSGPADEFLNQGDVYFSPDGVKLSSLKFVSALINGRGSWKSNKAPLARFPVKQNGTYGFYLINPGLEYAFEVSVDNHKIKVTGTDTSDITVVEVDSVIVNIGERYKIQLETNAMVDNYWIRLKTLDGIERVKAILHYRGADDGYPTTPYQRKCLKTDPCKVLNCPYLAYPTADNKTCIHTYTTKLIGRKDEINKIQTVDEEIFIDLGFAFGSSTNGYRFVFPKSHLYTKQQEGIIPCEEKKCTTGCYCTRIIHLPFNKSVQLVFTNMGDPFKGTHHHTVHIHGYDFAVMTSGFSPLNLTSGKQISNNGDIKCPAGDRFCRKAHWVKDRTKEFNVVNPPLKDTIILSYGGYTVTRIRTDNPGYWFLHCHQALHAFEGMSLVLAVAPDKAAPAPPRFQYCSDYTFSHEDYENYQKGNFNVGNPDKKGEEKKETISTTMIILIVAITLGVFIIALQMWIIVRRLRVENVSSSSSSAATWKVTKGANVNQAAELT